MKLPSKPLLWLGGIVVIGAVLVMQLSRNTGPAQVLPQEAGTGSEPGPSAPPPPATAPSAAGTDTPPWMDPGSRPRMTAANRALSRTEGLQPSASEVARAVVQVREQAARNEHAADELLRQIDAMKATGQAPQGVNLDALRNNLLVAKRAQALAREVADLTQQADTPARQKRIDDITHELQQLQSQLRHDVGSMAAAPVAPAVLGRKQ